MKNRTSIIALAICISFFSIQGVYSQETYKKIQQSEVPVKVKEAFSKTDKDYVIKEVAIDTRKSGKANVYLVTLIKGKSTRQYLVNAEGKILEMLE